MINPIGLDWLDDSMDTGGCSRHVSQVDLIQCLIPLGLTKL